MREIYIKSKAGLLPIGRRGENLATRVHLAEVPAEGQAVTVYVLRNGDTAAYPASNVEITDSEIIWTVTSVDTGKSGRGKVQYRFADSVTGEIIKTEIYHFVVGLAIDTEVGPAPDPYETWLDSLTDLAGQAQIAARDAEAEATAAAESAEQAETSAQNAEQSASSAGTHATNAQNSATTATQKATQAAASEANAQTYAEQAQASAGSAGASAEAASASATSAGQSKDTAQTAAQTATTKASEASASATSAASSATTATTKAGEASASATTASTKATEASQSATSAAGSASTASTKASEASASATSASGSASTATTKASEASASASAAAGSASSAQTAQAAAEAAQTAAEAAAQTLVIDSTLTQSGQAADAKKVGDEIGTTNSRLEQIYVEKPVNSLVELSAQNMLDMGVHVPTVAYDDDDIEVTVATSGTNTWGYPFDTVAGKTYRVRLTLGASDINIRIVKGSSYSSTKYIYGIIPAESGAYDFTFVAQTDATTIWFSAPRTAGTFSISDISIVDAAEKTWKYGSLSDSLLTEDFPPTAKAVGDAITPHIIGETNTFVGKDAGKYTTESTDETSPETYDKGRYNVSFGTNAMMANTEGHHSTGVGFCALRKNTTGYMNTAIGEDAMYENLAGNNNVAIGSHGMQNNNGNQNVSIGAEASRYATSFNRTVAIGYKSNYANHSGSDNILIGAETGMSVDADNCIVIGSGLVADGDNEIIIGDASQTVMLAGRLITFNQDGTVTWSAANQ